MGLNDGQIIYGKDLQSICNSIIWNAIEAQKEILAASRSPDYLENYLVIDTFNAAAGDNNRVDTNAGSTSATWDSTLKAYKSNSANTKLETSILKVLPNSDRIGGVYVACNYALSGTSGSITVNVSTNSGANWFFAAGQTIGSYLNCSGTSNMGSVLALRFVMSGTSAGSATLFDYGVLAFPYTV